MAFEIGLESCGLSSVSITIENVESEGKFMLRTTAHIVW